MIIRERERERVILTLCSYQVFEKYLNLLSDASLNHISYYDTIDDNDIICLNLFQNNILNLISIKYFFNAKTIRTGGYVAGALVPSEISSSLYNKLINSGKNEINNRLVDYESTRWNLRPTGPKSYRPCIIYDE